MFRQESDHSTLQRGPSPYHLGATGSIEVISAGQKTLVVIYGGCRSLRLLHFTAASPLQSLMLKRQSAGPAPVVRGHCRPHSHCRPGLPRRL